MDFVAIDFETANKSFSSACALGLVEIRSGAIYDEKYWLIKPPKLYFNPFHIHIHGITKKDVIYKPKFDELWPEILPFVKDKLVLAHNTSFDISVLKSVLKTYGMHAPRFEYACTVKIARKTWPYLDSYKLDHLAAFLNIDFTHHNALEDAYACSEIAKRACIEKGVKQVDLLLKEISLKKQNFLKNSATSSRNTG